MPLHWLRDLAADLRYTQRTLRRSPVFLLTAVLSLALGIGANTAIFTALDAVLWKPLPVADPHSLVRFSISRMNRGDRESIPGDFGRQLAASGIFSDTASVGSDGFSLTYDGRAERVQGEVVSPNFFAFIGLDPFLGQNFTPGVRAGGWAPEAVLSYRFWMRRFGGDPHVIGSVIRINTHPFTIVGVSSREFQDLERGYDPDLRMPAMPDGQTMKESEVISGGHLSVGMARLAPGVTLAHAAAVTDALFQNYLRTATADVQRQRYGRVRVLPGERGWSGDVAAFEAPLLVLLALVGVALLIACANLAALLLARASARGRELALRASIGAGRMRLVRQMFAESVSLAMLGGALAIPVANWSAAMLFRFLPQGHTPLTVDLRPDWRAVLFAFAVSLITGVLFGLAPALQATRGNIALTLKSDSAASLGDRRAALRKLIVGAQVAFSMVLLIAAGVFIQTLQRLRPADYRVPTERVLLFTLKPQQEIYSPDRVRAVTAEIQRRIADLPGVAAVALAENGPLGSRSSSTLIETPGHEAVNSAIDSVSPRFFDTVGIPFEAGRDFRAADRPESGPVAIVNQILARSLFPNQNPIGRTLRRTGSAERPFEIVGVVADSHYYDIHADPPPAVWFALQQDVPYMPTLHVRTSDAATSAISAAVRREFDAIDQGFPIFNIKTLELRIQDSLARERLVAALSTVFGMLALALAAIGLYGVLAYLVTHRTREIGIRMALGSSAGSVIWLMAREALTLVGTGGLAGILLAMAATRLLARYLLGAASVDALTLTGACGVMFLVAGLAVSLPAMRACRIDPLRALRQE